MLYLAVIALLTAGCWEDNLGPDPKKSTLFDAVDTYFDAHPTQRPAGELTSCDVALRGQDNQRHVCEFVEGDWTTDVCVDIAVAGPRVERPGQIAISDVWVCKERYWTGPGEYAPGKSPPTLESIFLAPSRVEADALPRDITIEIVLGESQLEVDRLYALFFWRAPRDRTYSLSAELHEAAPGRYSGVLPLPSSGPGRWRLWDISAYDGSEFVENWLWAEDADVWVEGVTVVP